MTRIDGMIGSRLRDAITMYIWSCPIWSCDYLLPRKPLGERAVEWYPEEAHLREAGVSPFCRMRKVRAGVRARACVCVNERASECLNECVRG